jgi:hypothetical protein
MHVVLMCVSMGVDGTLVMYVAAVVNVCSTFVCVSFVSVCSEVYVIAIKVSFEYLCLLG